MLLQARKNFRNSRSLGAAATYRPSIHHVWTEQFSIIKSKGEGESEEGPRSKIKSKVDV